MASVIDPKNTGKFIIQRLETMKIWLQLGMVVNGVYYEQRAGGPPAAIGPEKYLLTKYLQI